jgi:hypothetical protein
MPTVSDPCFEDQVIECTALDEVEYDDPAEWPQWTDQRWEIGPAITPDEASPADVEWLNTHPILPEPFEPSDEDLDEMARHAEWADRVEAIRREDDAQVEARCRFG